LDGIENLRTFVAVADAGSLAGAARRLGVAASVVTKRLDQLESKIRGLLFTRTTRRVALTDLGTRYMSSVRRLMQDYDEVFAEMSNVPTHIEGDLRIKVPTSMTVAYLAQTLADFQQQFPLVNLDVALIDRAVNPREEGFDIALAGLPISFPGVVDEPICPLKRILCAAPSYLEARGAPTHPNDLVHHDCLVFVPAGRTWLFESSSGLASVELRPKMSANDAVVLTAAALEGNGIALLPSYAVGEALRSGQLVRVLNEFTPPMTWMKALVPETRAGIPRVKALLAFLKARYSPVPPWEIGN
jgi:DNA-binding transcriptional LysR family regulator